MLESGGVPRRTRGRRCDRPLGALGGHGPRHRAGDRVRRRPLLEEANAASGNRVVRAVVGVALAALAAVPCSGSAATRTPLPRFDHVLVVVLENKSQASVLGNREAPNFNNFAKHYAVLSRYGGVAHPSLPNYLALVSGSTHGITSDCTSCVVSARNLADMLEHAHRSWKAYAEKLPSPGWTGTYAGLYAKRHVPFLYFRDILASPARRRHVVPMRQLSTD